MFALFLIAFAAGNLVFLLPLSPRLISVGFFRFHALTSFAFVLLAVSAGVRFYSGEGHQHALILRAALPIAGSLLVVFSILEQMRSRAARPLLAVATFVLLVFPFWLGTQLDRPPHEQIGEASVFRLALGFNLVFAGILLGGSNVTMWLGHWYLNIPGLDIRHLARTVNLLIASLVARVVVLLVSIVLFPEPFLQPFLKWNEATMTFYFNFGLFFLLRIGLGIVIPAVLLYMVVQTVKLRATQSATGILFVIEFLVICGELIAMYLMLKTGIPA